MCVAIVSQNLEDWLLDFKKSKNTLLPSVATTIRSNDPAWAHGYTALANIEHVICRYCKRDINGGKITRLKEQPCKMVPRDVKWKMKRHVLEGKKDRAKKIQWNEEIGNPYGTPTGDANEDDVEIDLEDLS